jgi:hypothetical protein
VERAFAAVVGPTTRPQDPSGRSAATPARPGRFRLEHGTDVADRFAEGEVPQDFDAITGAERYCAVSRLPREAS